MTNRMTKPAENVVPQNDDELLDFIDRFAAAQTLHETHVNAANQQITEIKAELKEDLDPVTLELKELQRGIQIYCEANRDRLTKNGSTKTVKLVSGVVGWRIDPPSVRLSKKDAVLEAIKQGGKKLAKFIRTKEEINKEALLADPKLADKIDGVSIIRDQEKFFVEPNTLKKDLPS